MLYVDTSCMALLLLGQDGAGKVENLLEQGDRWHSVNSSVLLEIELIRVARRTRTPVESARTLLTNIELLEISREVVDGACALTGELKSLDAIHLASALILHSNADPVTVLTHDAFNLPKDAIRRFETTTGYKLKTISSGEAGVANQLVLTKKHPKYDAVYGIDTYSAGLADKEGVIDSYTSSKLPESGKRYVIGGLNPIDQGDVCVNTDHAWFKKKSVPEPTSLDDLAKPEYAKLLVVSNPTTSSPGLAFLAGVEKAKGRKGADAYWKALLAGGTKVAKSWSEAYNSDFSAGEGKGQYPLVLSYGSSPAETKGATGSVDSTCVRQVEYAGVVKGGGNQKGARAFVDYMLSDSVQAAIPGSMYMFPINTAVALPEKWKAYARLADEPILPDAADVTKNREEWLKSWTSIYESAK